LWSIIEVLIVCVCYASAPFLADRRLADVPSIGVIAVSLTIVTIIYAPIAAFSVPSHAPRSTAVMAVIALAVVCTGLAFIVFFRLIDEVGPARAGLITFANPVVAIALGAVFLDELITVATVCGFVLVIVGCWLATRSRTAAPVECEPASATR
jgi:drug/metabolite transporter (DMT)-like permease